MKNNYQGLHRLEDLIFNINKPILGKKGIHFQKLLKDWLNIVGEDVARYTIPVKISTIRSKKTPENVLYLATNNASSSAELVYKLGIIKEQLNLYFGYEYIHQLKLVQAIFPVKNEVEKQVEVSLSETQQEKSKNLTAEYKQEDEIKEILDNFAKLLAASNLIQ